MDARLEPKVRWQIELMRHQRSTYRVLADEADPRETDARLDLTVREAAEPTGLWMLEYRILYYDRLVVSSPTLLIPTIPTSGHQFRRPTTPHSSQ